MKYMHSPSSKHGFSARGVSLWTNPTFRAKNQSLYETAPVIEIPGLQNIVDRADTEEMTLCPVRALHHYIKRTAESRRDHTAMFMCHAQGKRHKPASKMTMSRWVTDTIKYAYSQDHTQSNRGMVSARVHDLRGKANSLAFYEGATLQQIMFAGFWKSSTSFTSHYLKDMSTDVQGLHRLGHFVAAQKVIGNHK